MATNKHAIIRYQALNRCFRNIGRKYFIDDLVDACNKALIEYSGVTEGVKKRQIYEDIKFMQSDQGWSIPLDKNKDGREVFYRYSEPGFSINNELLNEAEANQLKEALLTLSRFKGLPQFEWIDEMIMKLESTFNLIPHTANAINFEQNPYLKGLEYITSLFYSIINKKVLQLNYKGFKQIKSVTLILHPYFLKQYNNRWFLFGLNEKLNKIANLAIDRIESIKETKMSFIESNTDFEEYFEDIVGVTIPNSNILQKIQLEIENTLYPYIASKPIHGSQKVVERKMDKTIIELELMLNYEFESMIFSFGPEIKILQPESLIESIKIKALKVLNNYKK